MNMEVARIREGECYIPISVIEHSQCAKPFQKSHTRPYYNIERRGDTYESHDPTTQERFHSQKV